MSLLYHIHRYFGCIRSFRPLTQQHYFYVQAVPGHSKETLRISYTANGLLCLEGSVEQSDGQALLYQHRFHELIYVPPKLDKSTLCVDVKDGVVYLHIQRLSEQGSGSNGEMC